MDKFSGSRRRSWQSRLPSWPFMAAGALIVAGAAWWTAGALEPEAFGDGTARGSLSTWLIAGGTLLVLSLLMGGAMGVLVNAAVLQPANRRHGLAYAGALVGVALLAGAPQTVVRTLEADRAGYAARLLEALVVSREKQAFAYSAVHRELAFAAGRNAFSPSGLERSGGFATARKRLDLARSLVESAPAKLAQADAEARAVLAANVVDPDSRAAVLERFDIGARDKAPRLARYWALQIELFDLVGAHLDMLQANPRGWEPMGAAFMFSDRGMFTRFQSRRDAAVRLMDEGYAIERELSEIDRRTNAGIDRVIVDESNGGLIQPAPRSAPPPPPRDRSVRIS